ncbi:MAG TPA: membrane bound O-acyl transferase family-domain-containing protein [Vicinamibacteria bacterium]|nr:membrane bound O-acyl transferase family-domain-containing protein [Vicinamibacteria bacterium]
MSAARGAAWGLVVLSIGLAHQVTSVQPAGLRMLVLIGALFGAMKVLVSVESRARDGTRLSPLRWAAFAMLWPGMRPALMARLQHRSGAATLLKTGLGYVVLGVALFLLALLTWRLTASPWLSTILLLPALSFLLHFGVFGVLAGLWRTAGADVGPLFRAPWRAESLGEFWSRRWNLAFSEMTSLAVYRPIAARRGRSAALTAAFLFSGILHEVAISLPVRAGYGRPLLYFAIHGALTQVERERGPFGRAVTLLAVVLPLPLLFHAPFLRGVIWPLLGACR